MEKYFYILIYLIVIAFGLIHYRKYSENSILKFWLYFLVYSFFTELLAIYYIYILKVKANFLYNIWDIVNALFYIFFYGYIIKTKARRKFIFGLLILYVTYTIVNLIFYNNIESNVLVINAIVSMILIVITIMTYYVELLNSESILTIRKTLFFWISLGVLIFNIGLIPVYVIGELISWQGVFNYIILALNLVMSGCFITGFIMSKKEFNS